jgi:hypothetical protein
LTFPELEKTYIGVEPPSTSHRQEGIGEEEEEMMCITKSVYELDEFYYYSQYYYLIFFCISMSLIVI